MTITDLTFTQEEGSGLHVCEFVAQGPMFYTLNVCKRLNLFVISH